MKSLVRALRRLSTLLACAPIALATPQLSAPTVLPGDTALSPPAGDQTGIAFARGVGTTLMVWEDARANLGGTQSSGGYGSTTMDIYAARIDDAGNTLDVTPIAVSHEVFSQTGPKVAWNGQAWLVVWTSRSFSPMTTTQGVYGARVSASGQLLDDPPIRISDSQDFDEMWPAVASDGNTWAVIWRGGIAFGTDAILGCLVSPAGVPDAPRTFFQTVNGVGFYIPWNFELAWAGNRYLMVCEHMLQGGAGDDDIFGQLFDASLAKVGGEFRISTNSWDQNRAGIASNGAGFFVTWVDDQMWGEVRGTPVTPTGAVAVPDGAVYQTGMYGSYPYPAAGWDGASWIAAWDFGTIRAARVDASGAMLPGSPFVVEPGAWSMQQPAVAQIASGVLVGWTDRRGAYPSSLGTSDLYGAVVDTSGGVAPSQPLTLSPPAQVDPDVAGDAASGYLVVWLSETSAVSSVLAQRVDAFGAPVDPLPTTLASGALTLRNPAVAWNGSQWLVAWENWTAGIFGRRVGANGQPLDPAEFFVLPGNTPDVAASGDVFLVVSTHEPINHYRIVKGMRVRGSDGALLDASPSVIGGSYAVLPAVAGFADRWLVAWEHHNTHDQTPSSVVGNFVLSNGTPQASFGAGLSGSYNRAPALSAGGSVALLAWDDHYATPSNLRARRIQADGTGLDPATGFLVSSAPNRQFSPAAGWDGARWLVAWNDHRAHTSILDGGVGDLYGSRVDASGVVVDPSGLAIAADFRLAEGAPAVAGDIGVAVTVYTAVHDEAPYGTLRVTLRSADGTGTIDDFCFGDGSGTACPCGNAGAGGEGCANSTASGAILSSQGTASVAANDLRFQAWQIPPGLSGVLFQGDDAVGGGAGIVLMDGLRCVGTNLVRLGVRAADASGFASWGPGLAGAGGWNGGATRRFQVWYRNLAGPCGFGSNLTNGLSVTFAP